MENIINTIVGYIWSDALVYLALGVGIYFTIMTRAVQIRYFKEMISLLFDKQSSSAGISSFQAFCMALSGRIGVGNIAGVATAIAAGGPGAVFWMIFMGVLGGASAFIESTLAQVYKHKVGDQYRGGSPFYIERGLKLKPFAIIVAIVTCLSYGMLVPGVQANTIADSFNTAFNIPPVVTGVILVVLLGIIIFGGVKRIANFAGKVVPVMAIGYILMMVIVLAFNAQNIPAMFALIFKSAFGMDAVFGGMVGTAISWGVRRAVFSNVAGAGEATFSSAAAEVSHPAKQGLVQSFSIYIDTVLVCTATALMILSTGMYNVVTPEGVTLVDNMPGIEAGTAFTQAAVSTVFNQYGSGFVAIAIFLFAFTCLVAYYYIAETTLVYLDNKLRYPILKHVLKLVFLIVCFTGSVQSIGMMWALGDIGFGSMCYLNFIAILLLSKVALKVLKDYDEQMKLGINPVFDPRKAGVDNADFWIEYSNEHGHKKSL
ncbi:sodium:alanine symporter [Psychrobacter sp. Choline-02u-13]|uniref:alanine/glycine:cation symporter family protein n=1 Tax=unclassified Psychrobacter TaxID=196806 RepID=UPI00086F5140|nr:MULTISPECIES: alanine/glycine:cation symporter family protein [unclassified Psychrobacter]OEH68740.1 MAG: sodium:alanine symporter [Psychrobacter sp. B29-1]PKG65896.1 sodium:alanine symporter [Psychrobacter sp. Choline-02u-13]PKH49113.1 sodium:alanine symporter [Psychrobacter sp. Choline-02u-9]